MPWRVQTPRLGVCGVCRRADSVHASGVVHTRTATFRFGATGAEAATVTGFECALDGSAFRPCSSPVLCQRLADGEHAFAVRTVSPAGADATPATRTWTVDTGRQPTD
jgi:hypothetical protein